MKRKYIVLIFVLSVMGFNVVAMNIVPTQAVTPAGTTGTLTASISLYNPGTPMTLEADSLTANSYYAILIGSNLATSYQQWDNFTASSSTKYIIFEVDSGNFASTATKLTTVLYGALNDTDSTATQLATFEFQLVQTTKILGYDWFMTNVFPIMIFFIIIGILGGIIGVIYVRRRGGKRSNREYYD